MRTVRITAAAVLLAGCVGEPTNSAVELPENRGTKLQAGEPVGTFAEFAWSADGTEIYFQPDVGEPQLKAVSLAGGAPRVLDGPRDDYAEMKAARDGTLYFAADAAPDARRTAYALSPNGGAATPIGRVTLGRPAAPAVGSLIVPSPVPGVVAYVAAPDSVYLVEQGQQRFLRPGCERILTFSPDGRSLLCRSGQVLNGLYTLIDVATGDAEDIVVLNANQGAPQMVQWTADGIKVFYYDFGGYYLRDYETATSQQIWTIPPAATVLDYEHGSWTNAGDKVAFWVHSCLDRQGQDCRRGQSVLHVVDLETQTDHILAVAAGRIGGQRLAFSPDGTRVAYVFEKEIFFVPVP